MPYELRVLSGPGCSVLDKWAVKFSNMHGAHFSWLQAP
jgi:hypothetical protein